MAAPRRTSASATSWGVVTISAAVTGTRWAIVNCASPVPGGVSMISTSSGSSTVPHSASFNICVIADITMGPRQIIGESGSDKYPIDSVFMPKASTGCSLPDSADVTGSADTVPSMVGIEGP